MPKVIGIDLGTTNSCVAVMEGGEPVVIYEWLCGRQPFVGTTFMEIVMQHVQNPPPLLRSLVPELSSTVEQVVLTALAKDPKQRFATVQAFAIAFEHACQE